MTEATRQDQILDRLGHWAEASRSRLSPLVGPSDAWILADSFVSEALGRLLDRASGDETRGAPGSPAAPRAEVGPGYADLREFFERFAPEVVHYLPRKASPPTELTRLREIHRAICRKIVADLPMTLGRFGCEIFAREWKTLQEELPHHAEASWRLMQAPRGKEVEAACRAELDVALAPLREDLPPLDDLLRLRSRAREALRRCRPDRGRKGTQR